MYHSQCSSWDNFHFDLETSKLCGSIKNSKPWQCQYEECGFVKNSKFIMDDTMIIINKRMMIYDNEWSSSSSPSHFKVARTTCLPSVRRRCFGQDLQTCCGEKMGIQPRLTRQAWDFIQQTLGIQEQIWKKPWDITKKHGGTTRS